MVTATAGSRGSARPLEASPRRGRGGGRGRGVPPLETTGKPSSKTCFNLFSVACKTQTQIGQAAAAATLQVPKKKKKKIK